jgi:hypothetical protein
MPDRDLEAILQEFVDARSHLAQQRKRHLGPTGDIVREISKCIAGFAEAEDPITNEKLVYLHHAEQAESSADSLWVCNLVSCTNHALQIAVLPDGKIAVSRDGGSTVYYDAITYDDDAIVFVKAAAKQRLATMIADFVRFAFSKDEL